MKSRHFLIFLILVLAANAVFADKPVRRTIVVKDGKVISAGGDDVVAFEELIGGKRAFLGVSLMDLSPQLREHFGAAKDAGVMVESVEENSPAAKAGLRVGDIITAIDGKNVSSSWGLRGALRDKKEGDAVRVEYLRNNARQTAMATLVERDSPRIVLGDIEGLPMKLGEQFRSPEWRARVEQLSNCGELQSKLKELEAKMKELERKLQK